jgi:protein-ribulosamine 3-kinase
MSREVLAALGRAIGAEVIAASARPVGGGSIHQTLRYDTSKGAVFVKLGSRQIAPMFAAEARGLQVIAATRTLRVPSVLGQGTTEHESFLCLEWLDLGGRSADAQLGEKLAAMHRSLGTSFGDHPDNFIGLTPQRNRSHPTWTTFYRDERLLPQLALAREQGADAVTIQRGEQLASRLNVLFATHRPKPSLLHGDLWGGNWGTLRDGEPVIFDPAVYCGDRETDLAMTQLFGGFAASFYAAYTNAWPLDSGASQRLTLYNLYHVLNHFNLFGGSYLSQARRMIDQLLADTG